MWVYVEKLPIVRHLNADRGNCKCLKLFLISLFRLKMFTFQTMFRRSLTSFTPHALVTKVATGSYFSALPHIARRSSAPLRPRYAPATPPWLSFY